MGACDPSWITDQSTPFTDMVLAKTRLILEEQWASASALDRLMALPERLLTPLLWSLWPLLPFEH